MDPISVLIADDEEDVLDIMVRKISEQGYVVSKANNGLTAWEKIQTANPDVIVLDINMPGLSGFEVLKKLRDNPPSSKWQPVIMVSARRELEDIKQGYSLEADHYITKPCKISDILKAIQLMHNLSSQRKTS
ncbi:hypothetical protein MNBD_BACTEROID05-611 [hydrothermal vent metagenome]|uniref:Response regulatory domain-containing protein n=1 Tax=hydrothermal vent metagenome TaxID=652676 RepID=A0A3B0TC78_9ZZZZ